MDQSENRQRQQWREVLYRVIFESDTPAGKWFDILLIVCILLSVAVVMLDSVGSIREHHGDLLYGIEWFFTILFTVEYVLRLLCAVKAARYARSFFGIVDLLAILPTYLSVVFFAGRYLAVVRVLRVLRIFRILRLGPHMKEAGLLKQALYAGRRKIMVFLFVVLTVVVIVGSLMHIIEGEDSDFSSIPHSVYWAIVTMTTVGYGDISPETAPGRFLAAIVMILGYSIIAVPTGIVGGHVALAYKDRRAERQCKKCGASGHDGDAKYCKSCGGKL